MWWLCFWNFSDFIGEEPQATGQKIPLEWSQTSIPTKQETEPYFPFCMAILVVFRGQNTAKDAEKA